MFDMIFCFILMYVRSLNYISAAINMFKWKQRGSEVWYILSVNTVGKIAVADSSWLMLSSTLLFAELTDCVVPSVGAHSPESNSWSPNFQGYKSEICVLGIEKHGQTLSHQTICLVFSVLRPRWKRKQQQVWGKKKFLGHIFPGNFGGKAPYVSQN